MADAPETRRVLVALDALSRGEAALRTAGALAAELDAELAGLFVEDADLVRLLGLPFARELCLLSGEVRPLSQADLERSWRRQAAALERRLAQAAGELRVRWSFRVTRGRMEAELSLRARAVDLVVLGERTAALPAGSGMQAATGPVLALVEPSAGDTGLALATRLARRSDAELVLLIPASDRAAFEKACKAGAAVAEAGQVSARCVALDGADPTALQRAVRREGAGCLVVPDRDRLLQPGRTRRLLETISCPIVLAR